MEITHNSGARFASQNRDRPLKQFLACKSAIASQIATETMRCLPASPFISNFSTGEATQHNYTGSLSQHNFYLIPAIRLLRRLFRDDNGRQRNEGHKTSQTIPRRRLSNLRRTAQKSLAHTNHYTPRGAFVFRLYARSQRIFVLVTRPFTSTYQRCSHARSTVKLATNMMAHNLLVGFM